MEGTVEFLGSKNIEIVDPFNGLRPSIEVKPGKKELIAYKSTRLPYNVNLRMMTSFKSNSKIDNLKDLVL